MSQDSTEQAGTIERESPCEGGSCRRGVNWGVVFLTLLLVGFIGFQWYSRRTAPVPELFDRSVTLEAALEQSAASDRPVFALLTADWCGYCQVYKRNALANKDTAGFLRESTVPVYIDVDKEPEATMVIARQLNLQSDRLGLPTTAILVGGRVVEHRSGVLESSDIREMIAAAREPAPAGGN